jgi:hypothetical protein
MSNLDQVTRDDIQREGLHQPAPLCSARTEAAQRAKDYEAHLKRMEIDPEYRMRWEQNEREMEEAKKRGYEHL